MLSQRERAQNRYFSQYKKPPAERKLPECGTAQDFQLTQALNRLKGQPVLISKTLTERKPEAKVD